MATYNKFQSFIEAVNEKVHNMGSDALTLAMTATANAPVNTNTVLANLTQIAYTNMVTSGAGSRVLTQSSSAQTSGVYKLVIADCTVSASGAAVATFQYIVIYNDTATNDELVCWYDYGSALTLNDGDSVTLDFDGTNGLYTMGA